jgi:hypothetical protein
LRQKAKAFNVRFLDWWSYFKLPECLPRCLRSSAIVSYSQGKKPLRQKFTS